MTPTLSTPTLRTATVATLTSCLALSVVALLEGRSAAQPLNATSHWLNGDGAARRRRADLRHTGTGLATHAAACLFWAAFFEAWMRRRPTGDAGAAIGRAAAVSAFAAAIDYTVTPHRFTPGWELVLSKRAMGCVYAAMAGGFALSRLGGR